MRGLFKIQDWFIKLIYVNFLLVLEYTRGPIHSVRGGSDEARVAQAID